MATVLLVRHGRTTANTAGVLAGRSAGVGLDDHGLAQARALGERLAGVPLSRVLTSPLTRCRRTAAEVVTRQASPPPLAVDPGLVECDYGEWTGRPLRELAREKLWRLVQDQPSSATFPGGESMAGMAARAVESVRRSDAAVAAEHGDHAVWAAVSHGDVIKAVLADALGVHLDAFQRIVVDPASVSIVRYTATRPFVLALNTHAGDLAWLATPPRRSRRRRTGDAAVGGGAGPE